MKNTEHLETRSCKYEKLNLNPDTFILNLNTIKVGKDNKQETFDLVKLFRNINSLSKNKFEIFLEVLKECEIKTGYDFMHFMSVIQEHCIDKNITDYEEVKKIWNSHKESITNIKDSCKKDKTYLGKLYIDKDVCFSEEDEDWYDDSNLRENIVFTEEVNEEEVEKCKDIFEGIDKVKVEKE